MSLYHLGYLIDQWQYIIYQLSAYIINYNLYKNALPYNGKLMSIKKLQNGIEISVLGSVFSNLGFVFDVIMVKWDGLGDLEMI